MGMELPNRPNPHRLLLRELYIQQASYGYISFEEYKSLKNMIYGTNADLELARSIINELRNKRLSKNGNE